MDPDTPKHLPHVAGPQRRWWTAFLLSSLVFAFGTIVGASIAGHFILRHHSDSTREPMLQADRMTRHMQRALHLNDEQREAVHQIVQQHHEQLAAIKNETEPRIHEVLDAMRLAIEEELTPEQAEKWHDVFERMRSRMRGPYDRDEKNRRRPGSNEDPDRRFNRADKNRDGSLDFQEMRSLAPKIDEERFRTIDIDGDGVLSHEELRRRRPPRPVEEESPPSPL